MVGYGCYKLRSMAHKRVCHEVICPIGTVHATQEFSGAQKTGEHERTCTWSVVIGTASSLGAQGRGMVSATTRMSAHIGCDAGHTAGPRKLCNVLTSWTVGAKTGGVPLFEGTTTTQPLRFDCSRTKAAKQWQRGRQPPLLGERMPYPSLVQ